MGRLGILALLVVAVACKAEVSGSASVSAEGVSGEVHAEAEADSGHQISSRLTYVNKEIRISTGTINFETSSAQLKGDETYAILGEMRDVLESHPDVELSVDGHTDSRGSTLANRKLSQRRAEAVKEWLVEDGGIEANRLDAVGHGEDDPVIEETGNCLNPKKGPARQEQECEEQIWRHNRRVVFPVIKGGETLSPAKIPAEKPRREREDEDGDEIYYVPSWFFYFGPGLAVHSGEYLNDLDPPDDPALEDPDYDTQADFQMFIGGGYMWLPQERLMLTLGLDLETSPIHDAPGWATRVGPTLRIGGHGKRWLLYLRVTPGFLVDQDGGSRSASFTLAPNVGVMGLIGRRFALGTELGPDFDFHDNGPRTNFDIKLIFAWFFGWP